MAIQSQPESEPSVLRTVADGVATLTLNRPKQQNALSLELLEGLASGLDEFAGTRDVRAVVLAANGPAFSAGHDLKQLMANRTESFVRGVFERCSSVMLQMMAMPQPIIARVHGVATAAGCQLVAACDMAVASSTARFATSGINYGLFCATPGVAVSRNVSRKRAFEMLFTGGFIDAATARDWGLVNSVVPAERLDDEVARLIQLIKEKPPAVCAAGKRLFYEQVELQITDAYEIASDAITRNMLAEDAAEGVSAFIEKRAPKWR